MIGSLGTFPLCFSVVLFLLDNTGHKQKTEKLQKTTIPSGIDFVWKFPLLLTSLHDNESPWSQLLDLLLFSPLSLYNKNIREELIIKEFLNFQSKWEFKGMHNIKIGRRRRRKEKMVVFVLLMCKCRLLQLWSRNKNNSHPVININKTISFSGLTIHLVFHVSSRGWDKNMDRERESGFFSRFQIIVSRLREGLATSGRSKLCVWTWQLVKLGGWFNQIITNTLTSWNSVVLRY